MAKKKKGQSEKEDSVSVQLRHVCLEYPYKQIEASTEGFTPSHLLGEGSAGTVFRAEMPDGSNAAVKVIDLSTLGGNAVVAGFEDEILILSKFRHPNLVVLMGWAKEGTRRFLIYEFLAGGDVSGRLQKAKEGRLPFPWYDRLGVARDAATGLAHLHNATPRAFHRDIKSANILLGMTGAKMADFGLSCVAKSRNVTTADCEFPSGTPGYTCPNYISTGKVTEGSEVYSLGMVLLELLLNLVPAGMLGDELVYQIRDTVIPSVPGALERAVANVDPTAIWPPPVAHEFAMLALRCVDDEESRRPNFNEVCRTLRGLQDRFPPVPATGFQHQPPSTGRPTMVGGFQAGGGIVAANPPVMHWPAPRPPGPPGMLPPMPPPAMAAGLPAVGWGEAMRQCLAPPVAMHQPQGLLGAPGCGGTGPCGMGMLGPYPMAANLGRPAPPMQAGWTPQVVGPALGPAVVQAPQGGGTFQPSSPGGVIAEVFLEVTHVHLAPLAAMRPEFRMLPLIPSVDTDGRRSVKVGRQHQPQWFEAVLVDAQDLNRISREACEISWGGADPAQAALALRVLGSGSVIVDEVMVPRGESSILRPFSRITFAFQAETGEVCIIMSLSVICPSVTAVGPAGHAGPQPLPGQAVAGQVPMQPPQAFAGPVLEPGPGTIPWSMSDEGTWRLECIYAPGFSPEEFWSLPSSIRDIAFNLTVDGPSRLLGRQHQPEMLEALLARDTPSLTRVSRSHFQLEAVNSICVGGDSVPSESKMMLRVTNLSQNMAVVGQKALHQGESVDIQDGDTLSFAQVGDPLAVASAEAAQEAGASSRSRPPSPPPPPPQASASATTATIGTSDLGTLARKATTEDLHKLPASIEADAESAGEAVPVMSVVPFLTMRVVAPRMPAPPSPWMMTYQQTGNEAICLPTQDLGEASPGVHTRHSVNPFSSEGDVEQAVTELPPQQQHQPQQQHLQQQLQENPPPPGACGSGALPSQVFDGAPPRPPPSVMQAKAQPEVDPNKCAVM